MKTILLILLIPVMIVQFNNLNARDLIVHSHLIGIGGGISSTGYCVEIRYSTLIKPRFELGFAVKGCNGRIDKYQYSIPLSDVTGSFTLSHILLSSKRRTLAIWAEADLTGGYELINRGESTLSDGAILLSKSGFIYGISPGIRVEIPISKALAFDCRFIENIFPKSHVSTLRCEIVVALKIKLY